MKQRLIGLALAAIAGLAASLVLASPASAHAVNVSYVTRCLPDGTRKVTWKVTNSEADKVAVLTTVTLQPADSTLTDIAVGAEVPKGGELTGYQILPGDAVSPAHLEVWATWTETDGSTKQNSAEHTADWVGQCTPTYTLAQDCTGIGFTFPAVPTTEGDFAKEPIDVTLTPSDGSPAQALRRKAGDPEKTVTFTGSPGLTVGLSYGDDFTKTEKWAPEGCAKPDLPTTGVSVTKAVAVGGGLLLVGIVLVVAAGVVRRRRTTPAA